jgi:hypothetical protein
MNIPKHFNLSLLACIYFELSEGIKYNNGISEDRKKATSNFKNNIEYVNDDILIKAFELYHERLELDFHNYIAQKNALQK